MWTVDFETEAIDDSSGRAPCPVGVAIKLDSNPAEYLSWGHVVGTNSHTWQQAFEVLRSIWHSGIPILCHNTKFDLRVAKEHFDLPLPKEYHDTLFLAFLHNPRDESLSLKPLADKYLDMPPQEQTDLKEWLIANVKEATAKNWGAYICKGPVDLVAKYAIGDVDRTFALYCFFTDKINADA